MGARLIEDATPHRRKRGSIARDIIADAQGGGFPRMRAKALYTPYAARVRIAEEIRDRPIEFQTRSLRRRLTKLDRMLTDAEAYAFDRAFNAWLLFEGRAKSVNPMGVGGGGSQGSPMNDRDLPEAGAFQVMRKRLSKYYHYQLGHVFHALAPWTDESAMDLESVVLLARAIKNAYEQNKNLH